MLSWRKDRRLMWVPNPSLNDLSSDSDDGPTPPGLTRIYPWRCSFHGGAMLPLTYFYAVDNGTQRPLMIFSTEHCRSHAELSAYEERLRAEYDLDGPRFVLRSSYTAPLPQETIRHVLSAMTTSEVGGAKLPSRINQGST